MSNYLVSISDQLVQIDPRGLTEMDELMSLISSFGFDNSSDQIPVSSQHLLDHPHRLGVFQDDSSAYWIAEFKNNTKLIDLNLVGKLNDLQAISQPIDYELLLKSAPCVALQKLLQSHQMDFKHDNQGHYTRIYGEARKLIAQLENKTVSNADDFQQAVAKSCRELWQVNVETSKFDLSVHRDMLPQNYKLAENVNYILVKDQKIAWVAAEEKVKKYWDSALSYEEFKQSSGAVATWALNAMF